jgi:tetratricopeptide (TPR) repeat protein
MDLSQKAIKLALSCKWEEAIKVNEEILKSDKKDVDALNRLARAYAEIGKITKAKKVCKNVLKIEPSNSIAQKALIRYKKSKSNSKTLADKSAKASDFLEEPGKTKIVSLLNVGDSKIISSLDAGDEVSMTTHSHRVCITNLNGKYLGRLPDDLAARLKTLVKGGNKYEIYVKTIEEDNLKIFIKEVYRGKDFINTPSFSAERIEYISYAPPELVNKDKPETGIEDDGF